MTLSIGGKAAASESLFFFDQPEPHKRASYKREKKYVDEQSLNQITKKPTLSGSVSKGTTGSHNDAPTSLAARVAELAAYTANKAMIESAIDNTVYSTDPNNPTPMSNGSSNQTYTDMRLQAVKYLTEDMLVELEEILTQFSEAEFVPNLPGPVIFDLHSDWTDLTENCPVVKQYPDWQTKKGKDGLKKGEKQDKKDHEHHGGKSSNRDTSGGEQTASGTGGGKHNSKRNASSRKSITKLGRQGSKLSLLNESDHVKSNNGATSTNTLVRKNSSSNKVSLTRSHSNNLPSNSNGFYVNYQFSSKIYREKGWTVLAMDAESEMVDNGKRILTFLKNSLISINESRVYNERYNLLKPCKIRFYGDYKREQIEKYKLNHSKLKRSPFAMCIMRYEIPKPLDLEYLLESISNPNILNPALGVPLNFPSTANSMTTNTAHPQTPHTAKAVPQSGSMHMPRPPTLFHTQTNDGTTCVFYPNGQLAIAFANVFGYYVESGSASGASSADNTNNRGTATAGSFISTSYGISLVWHNIHNSFSAVVYDKVNETLITRPKTTSNVFLMTDAASCLSKQLTSETGDQATGSPSKQLIKPLKSRKKEIPMLAVISPQGYCVVYRKNGQPKFVCTEQGGCLCDRSGAAYFQWKWNDIRHNDNDSFKDQLLVDLNDCIRLEYKSPSNIKLKFKYDKEFLDFDLSCLKENQSKLNDLLGRIASEIPLKSKASQIKMAPNAKAATIVQYKQFHAQTQQQALQSLRNSSVNTNKELNESSLIQLDKLLESSVSYKDVPVMKDLLLTQKKIRKILDEWLAYCRSSLGILDPEMYLMPDMPPIKSKDTRFLESHSDFDKVKMCRRKSRSAENLTFKYDLFDSSAPPAKKTKKSVRGLIVAETSVAPVRARTSLIRSKSAFISILEKIIACGIEHFDYYLNLKADNLTKQQVELFERIKKYKTYLTEGTAVGKLNRSVNFKSSSGSNRPASSSNMPSKIMTSDQIWLSSEVFELKSGTSRAQQASPLVDSIRKTMLAQRLAESDQPPASNRTSRFVDELNILCPISLHHKLALQRFDTECKCKKFAVPMIGDVEFDYLIRLLPSDQLAVVVVIDSTSTSISNIETIVEKLYTDVNKNRLQPCKESMKDEVRYFYYDITLAAENSDHTRPLLINRHNVLPGMVLIYKSGKLLFCDHIFNGYGFSELDFLKQLQKSREDSVLGKFLPYNFRFARPAGRTGPRTAWGGQIGGLDANGNSTSSSSMSNNIYPSKLTFHSARDAMDSEIRLPRINNSLEV